jgi:hypothetical protein
MAEAELDRLRNIVDVQGEGQPSDDDKAAYKAEWVKIEKLKTWPCNIWNLGEPTISSLCSLQLQQH